MAALTPIRRIKIAGEDRARGLLSTWAGAARTAAYLVAAIAALQPHVLKAQSVYQVRSVAPAFVAAGANGATLVLSGTLPSFAQGQYQVCFYTGFGSNAALTPALTTGPISVTVPASTIQAIPAAQFTAQNNFAFPAAVYIVPTGTTCNGSFDANLTNSLPVPVVEPLIAGVTGASLIPQTNPATGVQAPPSIIVLTGSGFSPTTIVTLGSFGGVTPSILSPTALSVPVPASFSSSPAGTSAAVTVCNSSSVGNFCSGAASPVTLTVAALTPSTGVLTVTPTPVPTTGTTVLTAQFKRDPSSTGGAEPGAPSGVVKFTASGAAAGSAPLVLDSSAVFVAQSTATQIATTGPPVITPAAGTYATAQVVTISDATPGAAIYYTADGSAPSTASTRYNGPFTIATTQTIRAIAVAAGTFASATASNAYTIFVPTPTAVAFVVQPATSATGTAITPAVTVAILDQNGNTITTSSAAVTLAIGANPAQGILSGTKTVNAVNGVAGFSDLSIDAIANGYTLVATSPGLTSATSSAFNITPYPITVKLFDALIGVTSTLPGTFTLSHPAPAGGLTVTLASSNVSFVTVSPASVNVPAGGTTGSFSYTGVAPGAVSITASAPNYLAGSASVTATNSLVSLGTIPPVAPGQSVSLALSLATNAPAGGVTINFTSSNPAVATITSSVFVPAGQRTAAANPQIVGVTIGTTTVTATAQGYAPDTRAVNVTVVSSFNPTSVTIPRTTSSNTTLNISAPAQTGGLTFTLTSDKTATATVVASVTIPAGQTSVAVPVTGVADGSTTIRANSPGVAEATLNVNVSSQLSFYYGDTTTGANLQVSNYVYLPAAPSTPTTVTVTSSGPTIATVSSSGTIVGGTTLTFTNVTTAGTIGPIFVQGQSIGNTTFTVSAPGYTDGSMKVTTNPSGFTFGGAYNGGLSTTTFSSASGLTVYPTILNPSTLAYSSTAAINPGLGPISVPITSSNTAVGTITTSPIIFNANDTSKNSSFLPAGSAGTTTVAIGAASGAPGFSLATSYTQFTATVTAPSLSFYYGDNTTGVNLEVSNYVYLPVAPPTPVTVTVTSNGPALATISKDGTVVGGTTLTFTNVTSAGTVGPIYIQGQALGSTTLTVTAPGYNSGSNKVTINPSGFTLGGAYSGGLTTTTFSAPTTLTVYPTILNTGSLTYSTTAALNPGLGTVNVPVTSSDTTIGTITTNPVAFGPGDTSASTSFKPAGSPGSSTVTVGTPTAPAGFSTPTQYVQFTATVTAPQLTFYYGDNITGSNLQVSNYVYLPVAPPSGVTVTVTSNGPSIATISKSGTVVGGTTLTFTNVTAAGTIGPIYIQGQAQGQTTLTATASGYASGSNKITVYPSGFTLGGAYNGGLSTTTFSSASNISVYPSILNPGSLTYYNTASLNPGLGPVSVPVTSSNTVVGTISTSPLVYNAGDGGQNTTFQPTSAGTTTITVGTPTGFSTPSQYVQFAATVTAPQLAFYNGATSITGVNLEVTNYGFLPVAPPNPVAVTITSNGPAIATISKGAASVGGASITFPNITSSGTTPAFFIQGQSLGSTTFTISAPGYTNGTVTVTVNPSGFTFAGTNSNGLSTTTTSSPTTLTVYPTILNNGSFSYYQTTQFNPGLGGTSVAVTSSNTNVGTITSSPLVFNGGEQYLQTSFKPVAAGSTSINIVQPPNYAAPSNYTGFTATVQ